MKGELIRGRRTNHVLVDHKVIGATDHECLVCKLKDQLHVILEPGNLVMCSLCDTVVAK